MHRRRGLESLPIDARNQPLPLLRREGEGGRIGTGPDEVATVQAAMTQPHASAIPDEEFDPGAPVIVKGPAAERCCPVIRFPSRPGCAGARRWLYPACLRSPESGSTMPSSPL